MPGNDNVSTILGEIDTVQKNITILKNNYNSEKTTIDTSDYIIPQKTLDRNGKDLIDSLEKLLESIETYET